MILFSLAMQDFLFEAIGGSVWTYQGYKSAKA